tara:strand:- start:33 stop:671 length:639 start_codon:yes stop_codon:yes gene_type:complete
MAGGANPMMAQPAMNPFQRASQANQMAMGTYANPAARAQSMMNPYQQQVIDTTLRDVGNAALMGQNQLDAQAQAAGAFGGSRHGIAQAEALKGYQQQALDKVGALRQQGYNTAMNNAFTSASGLQNVGQQAFNMGQAVQQQQGRQGALQQAAMQSLIDAGRKQFAGYAGQPTQAMNAFAQGLTGVQRVPMGGEQSYMNPGLLNYMQAFGMMG